MNKERIQNDIIWNKNRVENRRNNEALRPEWQKRVLRSATLARAVVMPLMSQPKK